MHGNLTWVRNKHLYQKKIQCRNEIPPYKVKKFQHTQTPRSEIYCKFPAMLTEIVNLSSFNKINLFRHFILFFFQEIQIHNPIWCASTPILHFLQALPLKKHQNLKISLFFFLHFSATKQGAIISPKKSTKFEIFLLFLSG